MQKNGKIEIWLDRTKCSFSNLLDFWIPQNPYVLAENEKYLPQWVLFRPSEWLPSVFLESKTASYFVKTRNPTVFGMVRPGRFKWRFLQKCEIKKTCLGFRFLLIGPRCEKKLYNRPVLA